MTIAITTIRPASSDEWDAIYATASNATYFHSREWAELWSSYTDQLVKPQPKLIVFSDGKQALLPLSTQSMMKGLMKKHLSSPAGTFGGWISADQLTAEHAELLVQHLLYRVSNLVWRVNPYDLHSRTVLACGRYAHQIAIDDVTSTLCLQEEFDRIYKRWSKGHASAARKAKKEGVQIRIAENLADWHEYYEVYLDSLRRWGKKTSSTYEYSLFQEFFYRNSQSIKLWLASYQDAVVAGAVCFYAHKHVVYWHGAALEATFHLRPVNLLIYEAVRDACKNGYWWFDFNPSGGHEGVKAFKKSFGATDIPSPVVITKGNVYKIIDFARKKMRLIQMQDY